MSKTYIPTIGLEIHAELKTQTKMFCSCKNDSTDTQPNINVCPICLGHPGTLPVINKEAVKSVLKVGAAVGGELADDSEFDRKNYFYPDIPKGYQISQYKHPLVSGGELLGVKLTRIHLEEDTATSSHVEDPEQGEGKGNSLIDFNRAGVPLMELVTEPVIHHSEEAVKFGREFQLLLQYLGVAEANMEKGEMRFEANISVSNSDKLGVKVEVKNLNSFRAAERAIEFEIKRQTGLLENGEKVAQETRGWNEKSQETYSQRSKETAHDYRYFPDPDLPKLKLSEIPEMRKENLQKEVLETPAQKREKFRKYNIKDSDVEFYINNRDLAVFFEAGAALLQRKRDEDYQLLSNYIVSDLSSRGEEFRKISPSNFAALIDMVGSGKISSRGAKDILNILFEKDQSPESIAETKGLLQISDETLIEKIVDTLLSQNIEIVGDYKKGKQSSLQFLVGQGMKLSNGSANPQVLRKIIESKLKVS